MPNLLAAGGAGTSSILSQLLGNNQGLGGLSSLNGIGGANNNSLFGPDGFGLNTGTANAFGAGIGALGDLAGLYFGAKQLGLAEDQLAANTAFGNRNIANQAQTINNSLEARYRAALSALSPEQQAGRQTTQEFLADRSVDGSPVTTGG